MTNVIILHWWNCTPEMNWYLWLKKEIIKLGHNAIIPNFPTPENQTVEQWFKVLNEYNKILTPETILVGHSLGAIFILSIAQKMKIKAGFLVAWCVWKVDEDFDDEIKDFTQRDFDWEKIKNNCKDFSLFCSNNDQYIKFEKFEELGNLLDIELDFIKNAYHFETKSDYKTFSSLLDKIKPLL